MDIVVSAAGSTGIYLIRSRIQFDVSRQEQKQKGQVQSESDEALVFLAW